MVVFQPSWLFPSITKVFGFSHSSQKNFWQKESLISDYQGSNSHPCQSQVNAQPFNQFMFHDNSHKYIELYYHSPRSIILLK